MDKKSKIYVAGHSGLVGSALLRTLKAKDFSQLIMRSQNELDLKAQSPVSKLFALEKVDWDCTCAQCLRQVKG